MERKDRREGQGMKERRGESGERGRERSGKSDGRITAALFPSTSSPACLCLSELRGTVQLKRLDERASLLHGGTMDEIIRKFG